MYCTLYIIHFLSCIMGFSHHDLYCYLQTNYNGILDLVKAMNARFSNRQEIQKRSQKTLSKYLHTMVDHGRMHLEGWINLFLLTHLNLNLGNLFPSWMPPWYTILFSKPFPSFSARMNACKFQNAFVWSMKLLPK